MAEKTVGQAAQTCPLSRDDFVIKAGCEERSKGQTWMFGTLLTLQLLCFSWLGYLSAKVMAVDVDYAGAKATIIQRLDNIDKNVSRIESNVTHAK